MKSEAYLLTGWVTQTFCCLFFFFLFLMGKNTIPDYVLGFQKNFNCQECFSRRPTGLFTGILQVGNLTAAGLELRQILVSLGKVTVEHALQPKLVTQQLTENKDLPV